MVFSSRWEFLVTALRDDVADVSIESLQQGHRLVVGVDTGGDVDGGDVYQVFFLADLRDGKQRQHARAQLTARQRLNVHAELEPGHICDHSAQHTAA
jgi:hypothetical protein